MSHITNTEFANKMSSGDTFISKPTFSDPHTTFSQIFVHFIYKNIIY